IMKLKELDIKNIYKKGLIYTSIILLISGITNFYTWSQGPVENIKILYIFCWLALYIPFFIYHKYDGWKIKEFDFVFNYKILLTLLVAVVIFYNYEIPFTINWKSSFIEMFARTGEELFFRGFLYTLFLKIFKNQNRPWIWAVIL